MIIILKDMVFVGKKDIIREIGLGESFQFPDLQLLREKESEVM